MEGKQPDEEKDDDLPKKEEDQKKSPPRSSPAQGSTVLTKKKVKGLLGIVFFRQPIVPPGCPSSPNRAPLPPRPCGLHSFPPVGWARGRGVPRRAARAAAPRYRCRSPRSLSPRPQLRRPGLPTANLRLTWLSSQRDFRCCRESLGSCLVSRGTSTDAVPATRTVGTTMGPEMLAGAGSAGHISLVLDHSGFWIRPHFATPPSVVGPPHRLETAAAGATIDGLEAPEPAREGSQRPGSNVLLWPAPQSCRDSIRSGSQEINDAASRPSQESRGSREAITGSRQRSIGSIRSHQEGASPDRLIGDRFQITGSTGEEGQKRHIMPTKEHSLELPPVSYVVFIAALLLVVFFVCVMIFSSEMMFLGTPSDVGASRQRAVVVGTTTVPTPNETEPLVNEVLGTTARRRTPHRRT